MLGFLGAGLYFEEDLSGGVFFLIYSLAHIANIFFILVLWWKWKKWGFWGYLTSNVIQFIMSFFGSLIILDELTISWGHLIRVAILVAALHIGGQKRIWPNLE